MGGKRHGAHGRLRWLFVGQGAMSAAALESLVDRFVPLAVLTGEPPPTSQASGGQEGPLVAMASDYGLDVRHVHGIGADPAASWPELFADLDVVVCCCWTERLQPSALRVPEHGWLNLHPSSLPAWRGADPVGWQLLTSPSRIGCSVHRMTEGHDDGPVVAESGVGVHPGDDRGAVVCRSGARLGHLAADVLADLAEGVELDERVQQPEEATWCPPAGTVPLIDPRHMRAAAGARVAAAFSPQPGVAVATLPPERRFAVTGPGRALSEGEEPGSIAWGENGAVAIAFRDRWLHGWTRALRPAPGGSAAPHAVPLPVEPLNG